MAHFSSADEGKTVTVDGESIGTVTSIDGDTARVDPDPDITDWIRSKLNWKNAEKETYTITDSRIDAITDEEIRLQT